VKPGIFRGLINFAAKLDPDLQKHLGSIIGFEGISKTIQNELLDCRLHVYLNQERG